MASGSLGNGFDEGAILGVGVVERLEIIRFIDGEAHASRYRNAVVDEEFLYLVKQLVIGKFPAS